MSPQFVPLLPSSHEVERITDEYRHVFPGLLLPDPLRISATRQVEAFEVS